MDKPLCKGILGRETEGKECLWELQKDFIIGARSHIT